MEREKIARWLHSYTVGIRQEYTKSLHKLPWEELSPETQNRWLKLADEFIAKNS